MLPWASWDRGTCELKDWVAWKASLVSAGDVFVGDQERWDERLGLVNGGRFLLSFLLSNGNENRHGSGIGNCELFLHRVIRLSNGLFQRLHSRL
jgi:hypothetical protein